MLKSYYRFKNRSEAGRELARRLQRFSGNSKAIVLALPRGGVPVAFEVAEALKLPLEVFVVRKLGTPVQPELAMGAVASGGVRVLNDDVIRMTRVGPEALEEVTKKEREEVVRREAYYRGGGPPLQLKDKVVILVDDGIATGSTMLAAVRAVRELGPSEVIVAAPIASTQAIQSLGAAADELEFVHVPECLFSIGEWYEDFRQTSDEEVKFLLEREGSGHREAEKPKGAGRLGWSRDA